MSHGKLVQFGTVREISAGVDDGRCRYTLELAESVVALDKTLREIPGVSEVNVERLRVTLEFWSDKPRAATLLRELIRIGLPLAAFSHNAAGLEEAYLRAGIRQVD